MKRTQYLVILIECGESTLALFSCFLDFVLQKKMDMLESSFQACLIWSHTLKNFRRTSVASVWLEP
jgi:hypothetical protein